MNTAKRKPEKHMLRVIKGGFAPADGYTIRRLREKGYHIGDVLAAVLTKPRNPRFHRLVHAFGRLVAENIEAFEGLDAHTVLKRLQIEGDIACDEMALNFPGIGPCTYRVPRSLSFASMEEGEFRETYRAFTRYVSKRYWPELSPEQIEQMAELMPEGE